MTAISRPPILFRGKCWTFGDNVAVDGDLMPLKMAISRETRLDVLRPYAATGLDPDFPNKVKEGDVIVGGRRFAQGNPHIQGLLGLRALGIGLVVESIPRGSLRNAVNAGLPILPHCPGVSGMAAEGDDLEVDFRSGLFRNLSRGLEHYFEPLPAQLLDVIQIGGWHENFRRRLEALNSNAT
jgi:3-isopropylmalate/(R)-2-methylmalate dehydratase small subunit